MSSVGTISHLLYLHGFRSSPKSFKARYMADWLQRHRPDVHWWCPQLPPSPRESMDLVFAEIGRWPAERMGVIGSSLGGFYATVVAERTGCRAVLLNPAVHAARDLAGQVGTHPSWHEPQQTFEFKAAYVDELRALAIPAITRPERYYALIAQGDEVLDWREMSTHYPGTQGRVLAGSDHAITEFALYLDEVLGFLDLAP